MKKAILNQIKTINAVLRTYGLRLVIMSDREFAEFAQMKEIETERRLLTTALKEAISINKSLVSKLEENRR